MKLFLKYLVAISMMEMIELKGLETKTLKLYTRIKSSKSRYIRLNRNRRKFDYDYEDWEKNIDSKNNIKLITRKYEANDHIFNTVNDIYGILRETNNLTNFNEDTDEINNQNKLTVTSGNPSSESKLIAMSSIANRNTDFTASTASVTLLKPDLTTIENNSTSVLAKDTTTLNQGSILSRIELESATIISLSKETPTVNESLTKLSIISTDSTNTSETTRDWREIIDFTVIPEDTVADLLLLYANTTPYVTETTLKPPPSVNPTEFLYTTNKFFDLTLTTIFTKNPFLVEIEEVKQNTKDGFFTSSLIVLLKTLLGKNESEVSFLLHGMNIAIVSMSKEDELSMFNATELEVFQSVVQMLLVEPADVMHDHLVYAIYALENRRTFLRPDINSLFTVVDTVYTADDAHKIADFLRDEVAGFPNKTKSPSAVARQAIELFITIPHLRIKGTAKEQMLMMALNMVIKSRLFPGQMDRRRVGDEKISRRINGPPIRLSNKKVSISLRHYPRRLNKIRQTTLTFFNYITRKKWKHTSTNNKKSIGKMKSTVDIEELYNIKSNTKPISKFRGKHQNKQGLIDRKKHHTKINATETNKLKRKNTNTQEISENTEDSKISSSEGFDTYINRNVTKNNNKHKDPRLSIITNKHRKHIDNHSTQLKGLIDFNRNEKSIFSKPLEKNNIKDKLVDWMNKYTNVIYQKLKNDNVHHRTKVNLRNTFKRIAKRKSYRSHRRKLNRYVFNTHKLNYSITDVVHKEKNQGKPMTATSNEYDEENILAHKILKAIQNTSLRDNTNLTNRKNLQDNYVIKAELIKLLRKNTNIIKQESNTNRAKTNTYNMQINRVKSKKKGMKETSYEIDEEINLKNKILAAMEKDFETAVKNGRPFRRNRKITVMYSNDEKK